MLNISDGVSRLGLDLEARLETSFFIHGLRSRLGLKGSRSRALSLETLHEFFSEILQEAAGLLAAIFTGTGWFWREIQITTMRQRCAWTGFWIFWTRTSAAPGRIRILVFLARTGSELDLDFVIC